MAGCATKGRRTDGRIDGDARGGRVARTAWTLANGWRIWSMGMQRGAKARARVRREQAGGGAPGGEWWGNGKGPTGGRYAARPSSVTRGIYSAVDLPCARMASALGKRTGTPRASA